ncbi:enoyl-CoA hydratase-related protein [Marinobacter salicampi]|uniref:enoyl-CoA hydratase-related protein n=1 Tax=Marinobacter salicampi TaxID=435907 RepID=UPI0014077D64|nr:enoyl-CoA hydratase-related protein [Marinobacter salicampi]
MSAAEKAPVHLEILGELAIISLAGGPQNRWCETSLVRFNDHIMTLARENKVRTLIITGNTEEAADDRSGSWFCGGLDTDAFNLRDPLAGANVARLFTQAFGNLRRFGGVTIAAINGHAHNEGLALALNCDFRLATEDAIFQLNAGSEGLLPFGGSTQLLPRLVGESWAKRMLLMEVPVGAAQASSLGLIDEVCDGEGDLMSMAEQWAGAIRRQSPMATRAGKQLVEHARMRPLETGFAAEREWQVHIMESLGQR